MTDDCRLDYSGNVIFMQDMVVQTICLQVDSTAAIWYLENDSMKWVKYKVEMHVLFFFLA